MAANILKIAPENCLVIENAPLGIIAAKKAGMNCAAVKTTIQDDHILKDADLIICAVLIPGAKAPKLVTREMIKSMKEGSVIVDVAIDQGGSFETSRPTSHEKPTFVVDGVTHYCVTNMPGAVARTSTLALTAKTLPHVLTLANNGFLKAIKSDNALAKGVNTYQGKLTYKAVAEAFDLEYTPLEQVLVNTH